MKFIVLLTLCNTFYFNTNTGKDKTNEFDKFLDRDTSSEQDYTDTNTSIPNKEPESTDKEIMDDLRAMKLDTPKFVSPAEDIQTKQETLDDLAKKFNEAFDLDGNVSSLTDKDMWKRMHDYIKLNLKDFLFDGHLSIELQIRYVFCSYIIAFIPAQFAFVVPGFYTYLIPKKAHKIPIVKDALRGLKTFFRFTKATSRESLFITFYFGRANSISEDLDLILRIPNLIMNDPVSLIRELLAFRIKAAGYDPEKYRKNKK
ncbi:hypothetical protein NGRA_0550 [Nosema granulosis]|uniref:Uncharacterized protein n=1 Tax=Nosema granulosis TaxID=83296 RepID=A0A9P6KZY4_9MICR|nr:hypothetical protein NGRA_0550 [Nosema granulosis]